MIFASSDLCATHKADGKSKKAIAWKKLPFWLLLLSCAALPVALGQDEESVKDREPLTLGSLSPEFFEDGLYAFRRFLQNAVFDELASAYDNTGISDYIDTATEGVGDLAETIGDALQGVRATFDTDSGADSFYSFVDDYIDTKTEEAFEEFQGICSGSSGSRRRGARTLAERRLTEDAANQQNFLSALGEAAGNVFVALDTGINSDPNACPAASPTTDLGAIALTLGVGKGYRFQNKKSGAYFEGSLGVGADFGILLETGDFRTTVATGLAVEVGREVPAPTPSPTDTPVQCNPAGEYRDSSNTCQVCPEGYFCLGSIAALCPVGRYCPSGSGTTAGLQGVSCDEVDQDPQFAEILCPNKGTFLFNDGYESVCDLGFISRRIDGIPCPVVRRLENQHRHDLLQEEEIPVNGDADSLGNRVLQSNTNRGWTNTSVTLSLTVYLPGNGGDMDGWGSWDLGIDLGLPFIQGITFHVGHPWYACKQCSCTNDENRFRNPQEFFDICGWKLSGFTIDILDFTDIAAFKQQFTDFKNNGGFKGAVLGFLNNFRSVSNFKGAMSQFEGSLSFSPVLAMGIITNDDFDAPDTFPNMPWSTLSNEQCSDFDTASKCSCNNRRFLRDVSKEQNYTDAQPGLVEVYEEPLHEENLPISSRNHRKLGLTDTIKDVMGVIVDLFGTGGITVPYCVGDCPEGISYKQLKGEIVLAPPEDCSELTLSAGADEITFSNIAFLLLNEINSDLADTIIDVAGPFGNFGIDEAGISITITPYPEITTTISGSPKLPDLPDDASALEEFFYDIFDGLTLSVTGNARSFESLSITLGAYLDPVVVNDGFSIEGPDGLGAGIYFKVEIIDVRPTAPAVPTQITSFGIELPMKICVRDCSTNDPETIELIGDVFAEVIVGGTAPPATRIGGLLSLVETWNEAFGLSILQIFDAVAGATFDLKAGFPAPPSSLTLGASGCLGSRDACTNQNTDAKDFILVGAYLGLDTAVPQKNFFLAMVSSFTVENILRVAANFEDDLNQLVADLPQSVLDSGITSPNAEKPECMNSGNSTAQASGEEQLDLDCYAYVAISPFATNRIESIDLEVPRGISFAGKLNLFDQFVVQAEAKIDVIATTNPSFFLSAELQGFKLGEFLEVGNSYNSDTGKIEGNATFLIDYTTVPFELIVDIEGAIGIPALKTYGEVDIGIDDSGASIEGEIFIFDGVLNPYVTIRWDWDFTYFYAELGNIIFTPGVLELKKLLLDIETANGFDLLFQIDITVLSFADIGASVLIEERNGGEDLYIEFTLYAELQLVDCRVVGDATLDLVDITKTEFGDFDITFLPGAAAEAIAEFVTGAVDALKDAFNAVVEAVDQVIQEIGQALTNILDSLDFLADAWGDFQNAVGRLLSGDPVGAAIALRDGFATVFNPDNWEDVGEAILEGLEDVGLAINDAILGSIGISSSSSKQTLEEAPGDPDQWGCKFLRYKTVTTRCWKACLFGCEICKDYTDFGDPFQNSQCVQEQMERLENARAQTEIAGNYGLGSQSMQDGNAAILNENRGAVPVPLVNNILGTVGYTPGSITPASLITTISGQTAVLDNSEDSGYAPSTTSFPPQQVTIDISPSDRRILQEGGGTVSQDLSDSISSAFASVEQVVNETVTKDMTGVDGRVKQFAGETLEPLEIGFNNVDKTLSLACSALGNAKTRKPQILSYDTDCGSLISLQSSPAMVYTRTGAEYQVPTSSPCGTVKVTRQYTVNDKCEQTAHADQIIYLEPEAPTFTLVPEEEAQKTYSTAAESLSPDDQGDNWPEAVSACGHAVKLDSSDAIPDELPGCGLWNVKRIWEAKLSFSEEVDDYCAENNLPDPPTSQAIQQFHVQDDEAPRFVENVPVETRVPFFSNYNASRLNAPLIKDIPTNLQAYEWGLFVGNENLISEDYGLVIHPSNPVDEAQCREKGIAHFFRKWTATDECGNAQSFVQKVVVEHPPETVTPTASLQDGVFSYSPGVEQSSDACVPGKQLVLGEKEYEADFNFETKSDACEEGQPWDENGCRVMRSEMTSQVQILSVKPVFVPEDFPADATVTTKESISPEALGVPTGTAFCSTPFEIVHEDDAAVLVDCGVWEIKRRWTIRPVYAGCEAVTDPRLATEQVQTITVTDVFAPEFISVPEEQVKVPFMGDYGPGNPTVGYPAVEDQVYHPTLVEHAQLHNTADTFLFVSYGINLSYDDAVTFKTDSSGVCADGSLADVSRTWTTSDVCGNTASWTQIIQIVKPPGYLFGDASGYQLASPTGSVYLYDSQVSQIVMSQGEDFEMKDSSISCSEGCGASDISVVLDYCPKKKIDEQYLPDGTVLYSDIEPETSKSAKSAKACKMFKKKTKEPVFFEEESFPVDFGSAKDSIESLSGAVSEGPTGLLTGPQTIDCGTPDQTSCATTTMSSLDRIPVNVDVDTGNLTLVGQHRVYNLFSVAIGDWFYDATAYETPPEVLVEAEGFVFVHVVDKVEITAMAGYKNELEVKRAWNDEGDFECKLGYKKDRPKTYKMPIFGNYVPGSTSKSYKSSKPFHERIKADLKYGLREIRTGGKAQNPSTHLLVSLWTSAEVNLEAPGHTVLEEEALWCSGLQYQFSAEHDGFDTMRGTYMLPNYMSTFELVDYNWTGGQLMTLGSNVYYYTVTMQNGLYQPDASSFCDGDVQPLARSEAAARNGESDAILVDGGFW